MGRAWDHWYHVTGATYGAWLPGDPRGFRTRHHREHVEGDYKNPPPEGAHDDMHARSKGLLKRDPVRLSPEARRVACDAIREALTHHDCPVAAIAVGATHYHILARFERNDARKIVGIAKKRSARALSAAGLVTPMGTNGSREVVVPSRD